MNRSLQITTMLIAFIIAILILFLYQWAFAKEGAQSRLKVKLRKPDAIDQKFIAANNWRYAMRSNGSFMYDRDDLDRDRNNAGGLFPRTENKTLVYAAGIYIATLKQGIPVCSEIEFMSEFQPGRITNSGTSWDSLLYEDPDGSGQKVYYLERDHFDNAWPEEALRDIFGRPVLIADAQTWTVFNDLDTSLSQEGQIVSPNPGLGVEMVMESFAWNVGILSNAVIFKLTISNKTNSTYSQSYLGIWADTDVNADGSANDVIGIDTARGIGFVYNLDNSDYPLAVGIDYLQGPFVHQTEVSPKEYLKFRNNDILLTYDQVNNRFYPATVLPDHFTLGATSSVSYLGSTDPIENKQRYYLLKGLFADGNPKTGSGFSDYYQFRGDPLAPGAPSDPNVQPYGGDQRILLGTGPFTLPADSSQEVWFAVIGAKGQDRLDAVRQLFKTDDIVQSVFNQGLVTPQPPEMPHLSATALDNRVVLTWQNNAEYSEDIAGDVFHITTDSGYIANYIKRDFQGYRVYRSRTGLDGSFTLLAQYDKIDSFGIVTNRRINTEGHLEIEDVNLGTNTGLRYSYIDTDVKNGYQYFFSVTAYDAQPYIATSELITIDGLTIYKPAGIPISLESSLLANRVQAFPMKPIAPLQYNAVTDSSAGHIAGVSDGFIDLEVIDPKAVTGDDYRVEFFNTSDTIHGYSPMLAYRVINVTQQQPAMFSNRVDDPETFWDYNHDGIFNGSDQPFDERYFNTVIAVPDDTTRDEEFGMVDGILLKVFGPASTGVSAIYENGPQYTAQGAFPGSRWFSGYRNSGLELLFGGAGLSYRFLGSTDNVNFQDVDIRFSRSAENWQTAYGHTGAFGIQNEFFKVPFSAWEVDDDDGSLIPRQLNVLVRDGYGFDANGWYLDNLTGGDLTGPQGRSYIHIIDSDYDSTAGALTGYTVAQLPAIWTLWLFPRYVFYPVELDGWDWNDSLKAALLANSDGGSVVTIDEQARIYSSIPDEGTLHLVAPNILLSDDRFIFSTTANSAITGKNKLKKSLKNISVVPNPFYIFSQFKPSTDNKEIKFTRLPASCSIKIFTVAGDLVKIIYHHASSNNDRIDPTADSDIRDAPALDSSTESWNLTNHRGKLVASGMYIALIEAPGIGKTTVKFAVIQ
ncbi:hypothetical protein HUU42_07635 [bacterium]|nr:hypothetical protein [bacterium]